MAHPVRPFFISGLAKAVFEVSAVVSELFEELLPISLAFA